MENNAKQVNKLLRDAAMEALSMKHDYIGTEHVLLAMFKQEGMVSTTLLKLGAKYEIFKDLILKQTGYGNAVVPPMSLTPRMKRVLETAGNEARALGHTYLGAEHVLLALVQEEDAFSSMILKYSGISPEVIGKEIVNQLQKAPMTGSSSGEKETAVSKFCRDLNQLAKDGKIDPVVGRGKEIERIIQVLSRRTKNNPVLIGEPGVGKTAIAEGLAQRIVQGNIPEIMREKRIVSLDLAGMLAGTKYRGDFEERLKETINELVKDKNVVLFVDELHTIIGAGASEGSMDASNILKPFLSKGEIQMIGATTIDEYRKHIEKDAAFERRLQPIMVEEPTVEETIQILKGIRDKYEVHHGVEITDEALEAAAELSHRYLTDRFLPDKAVDLIDEAASMIRVKNFVAPNSLKELEEKLDVLEKEKEQAVANQAFEKAASLRDETETIRRELKQVQEEWKKQKKLKNMMVGFDQIAKIVSQWSNVPVTKMTVEESERYLNLDKELKSIVIGQDLAIDAISHAIKRSRVGLADPKKPVGSFIFVGPTGVGKTYLAKSLAKSLFGDEEAMIRIDMSEYMEKHSVSRLVGSPPGYVGYDDGGQLTEAVRRKPYSVVLFDEIEKAHPDVFHILLQVLDDGRLTDSKGRVVNFKNTVLIMTSNVGATSLNKRNTMGFAIQENENLAEYEKMKEIIHEELKKTFRPEFLNRVDDIIVFQHLKEDSVQKIVGLMTEEIEGRLQNMDIHVEIDKKVQKEIAKAGYDENYGARPLRRTMENLIENRLSEEILAGKISKNEDILIDYDTRKKKIVFRKKEKADEGMVELEETVK